MPLGAFKAALMGTAGITAGESAVLLSNQLADGDSALAFTSGIDSTYGEYIFKFYNINPAADVDHFGVQFNAAGGSDYDENITATLLAVVHAEGTDASSIAYDDGRDQQGTDAIYIQLSGDPGGGSDESLAGEMHLYNPSNTTYVKHFYIKTHFYMAQNRAKLHLIGGYINTTTAITAVNFQMVSGDFDGRIKMWGVK